MTRIPAWLSGAALLAVMLLGSWYLTVGVLDADPIGRRRHAVVDLSAASGLRPGSDVVYRGVNIGNVEEIHSVAGGVRMRISYDATYKIPVAGSMRVENLSALGEPVFAFLPDSPGGPWLDDNAHLTESVKLPSSVPQLLATTSGLLEQTDTEALARLIETFTQTVTGLESVMPTVGIGAELLLATLLRHQQSLETALNNTMRIMTDVGWMKPTMTAAPAQMDEFGRTLGIAYQYLYEGSAALRGNEILGSWHEQEAALVDYLQRISPEIGAIGAALRPVTMAAGPMVGLIDLARLLENLLAALPGDSVRFTVTTPR
ncbi:MlaD family protein [Nocardia sp. NPDC005366]|uniref:MlaD family protein n=1 Tax=Nocardia sp. NPDC005366 TaxID=3156878 RepID=UPI0033BF5FCF